MFCLPGSHRERQTDKDTCGHEEAGWGGVSSITKHSDVRYSAHFAKHIIQGSLLFSCSFSALQNFVRQNYYRKTLL